MPKEYRTCAFCGIRQHKSNFLRVVLPDVVFDFWQNMNGRGFYVCQQSVCINKVFKKKALYKYLNLNLNENSPLLELKLQESIKNSIIYNIGDLFNKYGVCSSGVYTESLVLCRHDVVYDGMNKILLDSKTYKGSREICIIKNKYQADKLIKYKNLITNIDGLFYGELNGIKKS